MAEAGNVTPELMAEAIQAVSDLTAAAKRASAKIGPAVAKFEELGINRRALKRAVKDRLRDDDEVRAENRAYIQFMYLEKHLVTEADLFGDLELPVLTGKSAEAHLLWGAEQAGYKMGLAGGDDDSAKRYPAGSPAQAAWSRGHKRGAADLAALQPDGTEVADTRKERKPKAASSAPVAAPEPDVEEDEAGLEEEGTPPEALPKPVNDDGALFDEAAPKLKSAAAKPKAKPAARASVPVPPKGRGRKPGSKVGDATKMH